MRRPPSTSSSHIAWSVASALAVTAGCGFDSNQHRPDAGVGRPPDAAIDGPIVGVDASIDTPPAATCFGEGDWQVCAGSGLGPKTLSGTINTDTSDLCLAGRPAGWGPLQPDACFIAADTITVVAVSAVGSRPLALVAATQLAVTGVLDVASRRTGRGAGSQSTECMPFLRNPADGGGGGGGAGGSFMTAGSDGGAGNDGNHQPGLAADLNLGAPMRLRGGCAGQPGGGTGGTGAGAGGGAVYLLSGGVLTVTGSINASGGGGAGSSAQHGGGGGGSGGLIVLWGGSITTAASTLLVANGGGGGGGASAGTAAGSDGHDPLVTAPSVPADGGTGGLDSGGDGGNGGAGFPATGVALSATGGGSNAGGGGGAGGAGYIQANLDLGEAKSSPAVTIR